MNKRLSFCVVSDMHFMAWKETNAPVEWVESLERSIGDIASLAPDFLVSNGDQTNGKERDWRLAVSTINKLCPFPVCYTMGNHEYYGFYEDDPFSLAGAQRRFLDYSGHDHIYYELQMSGVRLLFLSTETYTPELNDAGWLSDEQLTWLEGKLEASNGPVIVFFHQPLNDTVAESNGTCVQSEEMKRILNRHPGVFLVSGHTHCAMDRDDQLVEIDGVRYVGGGCLCGDRPQSRWFDVYEDRIVLKLRDHLSGAWVEAYEKSFPLVV